MTGPTIQVADEALIKALNKLDRELSEDLEAITLEGAEIVVRDAQQRAPRQSGEMADSVHAETAQKAASEVTVSVGPDDEYFYSLFLELGTDPHTVKRDRARGLEVEHGEFRAGAEHPGASAQPFLRPALDENEDAVAAAIIDGLNELLK